MDIAKNPDFDKFVRDVRIKPYQFAVLIPENAILYLEQADYIAVDDTFNLIEEGFLLMTMLLKVDGILLPGAWFIHYNSSSEVYEEFFSIVQRSVPKVMNNSY